MTFSIHDRESVIERYLTQYAKYGYSPKSLGWDKGKQDIRFKILLDFFQCQNKSILDIGCGFGDLNKTLQSSCGFNYKYHGIDLVNDFIDEAKHRYSDFNNISFSVGDFTEADFDEKFDIIIASGIFNIKFERADNYAFIERVIKKASGMATEGVAFDFLSDKVDFRHEHTFHSSPEKILSIAFQCSRNIVLRNNYFPFEFSVCVMKDDSFSVEDTIFNKWKMSIDNHSP